MRGVGYNNKQKIKLRYILIGFLISTCMILVTTPLHEAAHVAMSIIDPYVEPVEFHVFDDASFHSGDHILSSALGFVKIKESYPGAFNDRPPWTDVLQEIICITLQIIISVFVTLKILTILIKRQKPKPMLNS